MSTKEITVKEFVRELAQRLEDGKTIDCCKQEILNLAAIAQAKIGDEKISVDWVDRE